MSELTTQQLSFEDLVVQAKVAHVRGDSPQYSHYLQRISGAVPENDPEVAPMIRRVYVRCARYLLNNAHLSGALRKDMQKMVTTYEVTE
jgi:hypothetical protein